ncbi:hypothetical protein WJX84_003646 [Apatococcus fuscideae]|uniref:N-alpha-acetyltransferase 35, NatC auxiliary subunit n=1 Tax=Apatococcus fuscideae TaxID=2026836 RepID=A0AAW1TDX8_9CHLO
MAPGELLHAPSFSLFEAMSAIEIGDPRMDASLAALTSPTAGDLIDSGKVPAQLVDTTLLSILDKQMILEMTWQQGHSLAQTVFTCIYMLRPDRASSMPLLAACCRSSFATCEQVKEFVMSAGICQDEDFQPFCYGLLLDWGRKGQYPAALAALTAAEDEVKASGTTKCLMQALHHLWHPSANAVGTAKRLLQNAAQSLDALGQEVPAGRPDDFVVPGFHPDVNRRLLAPQPPRKVPVLGWKAACQELSRMLADLQAACAVSIVTSLAQLKTFLMAYAKREAGALARSVLHWLLRTSAYIVDAPKPATAPSSKAGLSGRGLEPRAGKALPPWVPQPRMLAAAVGLPPDGPTISPEVDMFVEQAVIAVQGWCQGMCLNRARQRRRHRHALPDWAHLYQHALNADLSQGFMDWQTGAGWQWPHPTTDAPDQDLQGPLATWVERETALIMLQHLLLGFELELYQRYELCMIYWYCDYLIGVGLQACKKMGAGIQAAANGRGGVASKPARSNAKPKRSEANDSRRLDLMLESQEMEVERELCQGMLRLCAGLSIAGALPSRPAPFNDEEHLFDQRFSRFNHCARPEPLLHHQYAESADPTGVSAAALFQMAKDNFLCAKRAANFIGRMAAHSKEDLQALDRVATQNTVALMLMSKVLADGKLEHVVTWDFSVHCCYPVLGLKKH